MSLYGKLTSQATRAYEVQMSALNESAATINQFGELAAAVGVTPHAYVTEQKTLGLSAVATRGQDNAALFEELKKRGYTMAERQRLPQQFVGDFEMWTVRVKSHALSFLLLYYVAPEAA